VKIAIKAKKIYSENKVLENAILVIEDGYIIKVDELDNVKDYDKLIDYGDNELIPGLIEPHIHGANGFDTMDCSLHSLNAISMYLCRNAVTGFMPTTITDDFEKVKNAIKNVAQNSKNVEGAKIIGAYVEGPYITKEHKGAHAPEFIRKTNLAEIKNLLDLGQGIIKVITIAPEKENALACIEYLSESEVNVSMGHTNATYSEAIDAIDKGANIAAHTFNGMRGFHHREPGILGAVLTEDRVYCEVICDMVHVHPAALKLLLKCKSEEKIILISDCIRAAGLKDGNYQLGELKVIVKSGIARVESGSLAGSTTNVLQCVRNLVETLGIPKGKALKMASLNTCKMLGLESSIGSIKVGKKADFSLIDNEYKVHATYIDGNLVFIDDTTRVSQEIEKVKNIIFDMDGTLINTAKITVQACQQAALEFDMPVRSPEKIKALIGWANCDFFPKLYPEIEVKLLEKYAELVYEIEIKNMLKLKEKLLFPGVQKLLETLKLKGYYLCIASTGSVKHVEFALRNSNIYSFFDNIKCNQPEKIKMVGEIIKNGPGGSYLMVGDKCKDFEAGSENNIITIAATYGFGSEEEVEKFDLAISEPIDLLRYLK